MDTKRWGRPSGDARLPPRVERRCSVYLVREFRDARLDEEELDDLRDVSPQDAQTQWRFARGALRLPELGVNLDEVSGANVARSHNRGTGGFAGLR